MPETAFLIAAFATLFVVINPPGLVPLFIALTRGMGVEKRKAMALLGMLPAALSVQFVIDGVRGTSLIG